MKFNAPILSFGVIAVSAALGGASAETLYDYLFSSSHPAAIQKSIKIAEKEVDRIADLLREVQGLALFLPTDSAWAERPGVFEAILNEPEGNVRYETLLAVSSEVPLDQSTSWSLLKAFAQTHGGVIDSAYGSPYFLTGSNRACLAEWSNGQYVEGDCANVVGAPVVLSDATVYFLDKLVVPSELEESFETLMAAAKKQDLRRRRV